MLIVGVARQFAFVGFVLFNELQLASSLLTNLSISASSPQTKTPPQQQARSRSSSVYSNSPIRIQNVMDSGGKRKRSSSSLFVAMNSSKNNDNNNNDSSPPSSNNSFRITIKATEAKSLTDGVALLQGGINKSSNNNNKNDDDVVILPWVGYGTYKLGKKIVRESTLAAMKHGYRCIDTAFIYGGETTEIQVGFAIQDAISQNMLRDRSDLFVITKHWRKYHGYDPTLECLRLSLKRLQLDYIDLWLMHWPGPAWKTMSRRKDEIAKHGPWVYATHSKDDIVQLRSETWRAMEDSLKEGKVRSIGVSNFSIQHLKTLKKTATIWPPAVNQIECHPLYPQTELIEYCNREGIIVQAYASLGGQDAGKTFFKKIYPPSPSSSVGKKSFTKKKKDKEDPNVVTKLTETPPVMELSNDVGNKSPGQILLRWAIEKNIAIVPKTSSLERMDENSNVFDFSLSHEQISKMDNQLQQALLEAAEKEEAKRSDEAAVANKDEKEKTATAFADSSSEEEKRIIDASSMGRLCWRSDPLRLLDFD